MTFWLLAITIALAAAAVLYYAAAGRAVNAAPAGAAGPTGEHFRLQLREIEADVEASRLAAVEAVAARAELAREVLRLEREQHAGAQLPLNRYVLPGAILAVLVIAFATYAFLGSPGLPAQPFASRQAAETKNVNLDDAIKTIEGRLAANPDDLRGWQVIAPVYMQLGRYGDAEHAFRRVLALAPPTADVDTDLAESLMMQNGGQATGEAADLLHKAIALDPSAVRPRFYLAAEAMRTKDYASAINQWNDVIKLGKGDEGWMPTAQAGLAAAKAGLAGKPLPDAASGVAAPSQSPAIQQMVAGLASRLETQGGSIEEWTRLVRSEIVLGDLAKAQAAYDRARKAYPDAATRADLDALAAQAGLNLNGGAP